MFEWIGGFIEMRGISIISALLIIFLFKLDLDQRGQITALKKALTKAEAGLDDKIEKYLKNNNDLMIELKVDVGKLSEAMKGICVSIDDLKKEVRDMRG